MNHSCRQLCHLSGEALVINLLPWRERERQRGKRRFLAALACALVAGLAVLFALYRGLESDLAAGAGEIEGLQQEIALLAASGAEADRLAREQGQIVLHMQALQGLHRSRTLAAEILASLARALPAEAVYRRVERTGNEVRLRGEAESHAVVAELMRNLAASPLIAEVELAGAAETGPAGAAGSGRLDFSLTLRLAETGS